MKKLTATAGNGIPALSFKSSRTKAQNLKFSFLFLPNCIYFKINLGTDCCKHAPIMQVLIPDDARYMNCLGNICRVPWGPTSTVREVTETVYPNSLFIKWG